MVEYTVVEFTYGGIYRGGICRGGIYRFTRSIFHVRGFLCLCYRMFAFVCGFAQKKIIIIIIEKKVNNNNNNKKKVKVLKTCIFTTVCYCHQQLKQ